MARRRRSLCSPLCSFCVIFSTLFFHFSVRSFSLFVCLGSGLDLSSLPVDRRLGATGTEPLACLLRRPLTLSVLEIVLKSGGGMGPDLLNRQDLEVSSQISSSPEVSHGLIQSAHVFSVSHPFSACLTYAVSDPRSVSVWNSTDPSTLQTPARSSSFPINSSPPLVCHSLCSGLVRHGQLGFSFLGHELKFSLMGLTSPLSFMRPFLSPHSPTHDAANSNITIAVTLCGPASLPFRPRSDLTVFLVRLKVMARYISWSGRGRRSSLVSESPSLQGLSIHLSTFRPRIKRYQVFIESYLSDPYPWSLVSMAKKPAGFSLPRYQNSTCRGQVRSVSSRLVRAFVSSPRYQNSFCRGQKRSLLSSYHCHPCYYLLMPLFSMFGKTDLLGDSNQSSFPYLLSISPQATFGTEFLSEDQLGCRQENVSFPLLNPSSCRGQGRIVFASSLLKGRMFLDVSLSLRGLISIDRIDESSPTPSRLLSSVMVRTGPVEVTVITTVRTEASEFSKTLVMWSIQKSVELSGLKTADLLMLDLASVSTSPDDLSSYTKLVSLSVFYDVSSALAFIVCFRVCLIKHIYFVT